MRHTACMKKKLAYDLPTRLFHTLFAALFLTAFGIAKYIDSESPTFPYHMLAGLSLGFVTLLRIFWGIFGSRYARFSSFLLHPLVLLKYGRDALLARTPRQLAHNPATSYVALLMMALALGLAFTGFQMAGGKKEEFEDIHELLANGFLVLVILHVLGIAWHTFKHREIIGLSMIHGKKISDQEDAPIPHSYPWVGIAFLIFVLLYMGNLWRGYDPNQQSLQFFGATLQLGEEPEKDEPEKSEE